MNQCHYHLPTDLNRIASCFSPTSIKAIHLNSRSVRNKMQPLEEFFSEFRFTFSAIMLSETWSTDAHDVFRMNNYTTHFLNRSICRGGGVALLLDASLNGQILDHYSAVTPDYEILSLSVGKSVYSVCYRPPNGDITAFLDFYDTFLSFLAENSRSFVGTGDFNIDMSANDRFAKEFNTLLVSNGFVNLIDVPTRVTADNQSILDLFITNALPPKFEAGALSCALSDHLPVFLCMDRPVEAVKKQETFTYQSITDDSLQAFRVSVIQQDWASITELNNGNEAYNAFLGIFTHIYKSHFPLKARKISGRIRKPWITPDLRQQISIKYKLYRTFLNTRSSDDLKSFKQFRNKLTQKLRLARKEYYSVFLDAKNCGNGVVLARLNSLLKPEQHNNILRNIKIKG